MGRLDLPDPVRDEDVWFEDLAERSSTGSSDESRVSLAAGLEKEGRDNGVSGRTRPAVPLDA